jgi:hypothetical protein
LAIGPEAAADEWSRTLVNQESSSSTKRRITVAASFDRQAELEFRVGCISDEWPPLMR